MAFALEQAGASMLACADIEEAIVLREAGVRTSILGFGAMSVSDLGGLFEHDLVPTISTPTAARAVEAKAARRGVRRAPIVGSVCMDMITIDVTDVPCAPGDEVVILGGQGSDPIDVREMAASIGTIPCYVLCRVGTRIERIYNPAETS